MVGKGKPCNRRMISNRMEHRPDHPLNSLLPGLIRGLLAGLIAVLVVGPILVMACQPAMALAWALPGRVRPGTERTPPLPPTPPAGPLQEVAPPIPVQQLQEALDVHAPLLAIEHPRDGEMLPAGPWELTVRVRDWPVVDAGGLGLGAHVVVQIDDQPPLRLASRAAPTAAGPSAAGAGASTNEGLQMTVQVPPLAPGSHRITAYAARPWGEAVKSPGAARQIRVNRVAANSASIPAPNSPQLLPVSPTELTVAEPVLLDWLLLDAPLQNLRDNDGSWRLRVTINGDSFLLDQNVPLWLKGWQRGSNSLQWDLVDGSGEPLNPPFNSLVQEVILEAANGLRQGAGGEVAAAPRWLQGRLSPIELAQLLGEAAAPPSTPEQNAPTVTQPVQIPPIRPPAEPPPGTIQAPRPPVDQTPLEKTPVEDALLQSTPMEEGPVEEGPVDQPLEGQAQVDKGLAEQGLADEILSQHPSDGSDASTADASTAIPETGFSRDPGPSITPLPLHSPLIPKPAIPKPTIPEPTIANPAPPTLANPERISTSSAVVGSARDQVNPDGSLIRPKPKGPLAGLRQRLNP